MVHQVRNLARFTGLLVLFVAVVVAVICVVLSSINATLDKQTTNISDNSTNINNFGTEVRETNQLLKDAIAQVDEGQEGNDEFTNQIRRGLDQINRLCEQTNCEGEP